MSQQYQWAEDDFDQPCGAGRLGLSEPVSGKTYVMYHGTTSKNAQAIQATGFRQSAGGMLGRGVYLSRDLEKARHYPIGHRESDRVVIKVVVNVGKVIAINYQGHPRQKTWHDPRYGDVFDTAWVPPNCGMVKSGLEEDCVWDPSRIKIIDTIKPRPVQPKSPVQPFFGYGAGGYIDTYPNMNQQCHGAGNYFDLPYGVDQLCLSDWMSRFSEVPDRINITDTIKPHQVQPQRPVKPKSSVKTQKPSQNPTPSQTQKPSPTPTPSQTQHPVKPKSSAKTQKPSQNPKAQSKPKSSAKTQKLSQNPKAQSNPAADVVQGATSELYELFPIYYDLT